MSGALELATAVQQAIADRRLSRKVGELLVGRLMLTPNGAAADDARVVLVAAGVPERLVGRSLAAVPPEESEQVDSDLLSAVVTHIAVLGDPEKWEAETTYPGLAMAVIDSIWATSVRYGAVLNVIARYRELRGPEADTDTPADLLALFASVGGPERFAAAVSNYQRTSSKSGILKADAVQRSAEVLRNAGYATCDQVMGATAEDLAELERRWTAVHGQSSGVSWAYFLMLAGRQGVKPDRMIRRFVADARNTTEAAISQQTAQDVIAAAASQLGIELSRLDYAIWRYQRTLPA